MSLVNYFTNCCENLHNFSGPVLFRTQVAFVSSGVDAHEAQVVFTSY